MPVRSLRSSVLKWPDRECVLAALRQWCAGEARRHPELVRLGCFGSYARGDWGPGSDLDLVAVVERTGEPFERRGSSWRTEDLPVPADLLVYTGAEWEALHRRGGRFSEMLREDVLWVWPASGGGRSAGGAGSRPDIGG